MRTALSDDRGTALTEAVIVIPFLLIVWFGLVALVQLYSARLQVQIEAGAQSMRMAVAGDCGDADANLGDLAPGADDSGAFETEEGSLIEEIAGCQPFAWAHSDARVTASVSGLPQKIVAGGKGEVSGRRSLMCNMKPVDGLIDLLAGLIETVISRSKEG